MELLSPESSHLVNKQSEETLPLGWTKDERGHPQILKNGTLFIWNQDGMPPEGWIEEVQSQMPTYEEAKEAICNVLAKIKQFTEEQEKLNPQPTENIEKIACTI